MIHQRLRGSMKLLIAIGAVVFTAAVLAAGLVRHDPAGSAGVTLPLTQQPDQPAPALVGDTLRGDSFSLAELRGEVVVVNVMASWCAPCRDELPLLADASQRWAGDAVQIVGIAMRDDPDDVKAMLAETGAESMTVVPDPHATMAVALGVRGVPETFVIDRGGTVRLHALGPITAEWIDEWLPPVVSS